MSNYKERQARNIPWNRPIQWVMPNVFLPDLPYNPDDPDMLFIPYDDLVEILERHIGTPAFAPADGRTP